MLSRKKIILAIVFISCLIDEITSERCLRDSNTPHVDILPVLPVQTLAVGKQTMLTCRPCVPDLSLVTDLQWHDTLNNTIQPKPASAYIPKYDNKGRYLNKITGITPAMFTENLPGDKLALIITSLTEDMGGTYTCTASYANTEFIQNSVKIETYVAVTWKDAPEYQYPIFGTDYKVTCEVTASPPPTVDWLRNGDQIKSSGRYVVETHGLLIRNVQESDDGVYTCRAAVLQTGELVQRNIRVEVQIKPEIQPLPASIDAIESQSFSIKCNATGKPVPEYTWTKDSTQQDVSKADRFQVNSQTGLLIIRRVEAEDYDTYTCSARNNASIAQSQMKLNVLVRPKIYEFLNITTSTQKESLIVCKANGRPPPEITFRRWRSQEEYTIGPQPGDDRIILENKVNQDRGETEGSLRIMSVIRSDDGLYECVARNPGDTAYKIGHITVEYAPTFDHYKGLPPTFTWDEKPANLSCFAQSIPNATVEWRINNELIKEKGDMNMQIQDDVFRSDLIITPRGQQYYTAYRCIAQNKFGRNEQIMELKMARLPNMIPSVHVGTVTATSIAFQILSPETEFGLPILAFHCQFKEEFQPDWSLAANRTWSPDSPYIVEGLRPQTSYNFRFAARNKVGVGNWGANILQSTPRRSEPEEPKTLHTPIQEGSEQDGDPIVISAYADHFELRWSIPNNNGEVIDSYEIKYCPGQKLNDAWSEIEHLCTTKNVHSSETSYEMNGLQPDTYYRLELRAHNAIGFSRSSNLLIKTARGLDVIVHPGDTAMSSGIIIAIAIGSVLIVLLVVDLLSCLFMNCGVTASLCRRTKRSPSDFDEETKLGSLYGWRFPLPYCSNSVVKERPPSPLPLPPPVKLGGTPLTTPIDENVPLNLPNNNYNNHHNTVINKQNSTLEFDGRMVHSKSGDIIGKNSAV